VKTRIKEFRARYGYTQEELARRAGVRRETIVFLEKGAYNPSLRLAHNVATILHATIEDLFIFTDEPEPQEGGG
jgi:putative transcriptional regulator